jgi:hypothetical protein
MESLVEMIAEIAACLVLEQLAFEGVRFLRLSVPVGRGSGRVPAGEAAARL